MKTLNTYRFKVTAICPVQTDRRDFYDVEMEVEHGPETSVDSPAMITVEELEDEIVTVAMLPIYQEDLTRRLAARFPMAAVKVTGIHGAVTVESYARV